MFVFYLFLSVEHNSVFISVEPALLGIAIFWLRHVPAPASGPGCIGC